MPEKVEVVLTFDDGPHTGRNSSQNKTQMVMRILDLTEIRGVFFIQSHAQDKDGNYYRGNTEKGREIIAQMIEKDHIVGIHTGVDGKDAHKDVNNHNNRHPIDLYDDLVRAKDLINDEGGTTEFVRPPFGLANDDVINMYSDLALEFVHWDVDPQVHADTRKNASTSEDVKANIRHQIGRHLKNPNGKRQIVVLLHDIQDIVAYHLTSYIEEIAQTIRSNGFTPEMHPSRRRTEEILRAQSPRN